MHEIHHLPADFAFMPAIVVAVITAVLCSLLSVIVVLKRLAFIGQGISHAGFGGIGTAMALGLAPGLVQDSVILLFCLAAALAIGWLATRQRLEPDSAIGVILVAAMAWGALMTNLAAHFKDAAWYQRWFGPIPDQPGFHEVLFGSVLQVGGTDLALAGVVALLVLALLTALFKEMVFFTFDPAAAEVFGIRTKLIYGALLIAMALTIVVAIRLVGFLLVSALLVIPGAVATTLSRRLDRVLALAVMVGLAGTLIGLAVSLTTGFLAAGPCIVAALCLILLIAIAASPRRAAL
jgi:ABC-type Mn2+/Zn2+ transport system permease subunit